MSATTKPRVSPNQYRRAQLDAPIAGEARRVSAALSSTEPVDRVFGREVLEHSDRAVDLSRAGGPGLPLLVNHGGDRLPVGRVENVRLAGDGRLRGELRFSEATEAAREAWALVEDGTLRDVSIGYRILDWREGDDDEITITRWQPFEASVVSVPADGTVGIGRNHPVPGVPPMTRESIDRPSEQGGTFKEGQRAERARLDGIAEASRMILRLAPSASEQLEQLAERARENVDTTADAFRAQALELVSGRAEPLADPGPAPRGALTLPGDDRRGVFSGGEDARDKQFRGLVDVLTERALPHTVKPGALEGNEFRGLRLLDMAELCLRSHGIDCRGKSPEQITKMAIGQRAISPGNAQYTASSFPALTENIATKVLFDGFATADRTWDRWCSVGSAPDFRGFSVPRQSAISLLPSVAENVDYANLTRAEAKETGQLVKYGGLISFTWEAILANDVTGFADTAAAMGEAAQATIDSTVYTELLSNAGAGPVMGDTFNLFDTLNRASDNQGTAALALAGIIATRTAMARHADENSRTLGIRMAHVLVPLELQDTADDLAGSEYLVDSGGSAQRVNTVRSTFTVIPTHHLTDVTDWYGLAMKGKTARVFFLNGQQQPVIEQESAWDTDAMHWKVRMPHDVVWQDWRGVYRNVVAG